MARRIASISDEEVKEFTEKLENKNTKKKTLYDTKVFKDYLDACDEKREIEDVTPVELQKKKLRSLVRYCSCHSNIKFISSRHRVVSSIYKVIHFYIKLNLKPYTERSVNRVH